ncbi:hypothetical protein GLV94_05295 [Virgibacillus halodenitrificans]|uniref:hypothetical protein n=1 Tax=Virgibacillus halodenitrificans TaxID=1482 RepID=UPI001369E5DD|nr:hypothetical protein [Virgibacillus halodenitrificans]MYL45050.1 hypothetical protein [Virgibacillus halodenitrificans]
MTPTEDLRFRLRKLINERIPSGGTETDTNFLDGELDMILGEASSVYVAASYGWTEKAGMLQGDIEKYSAGDEQYTMTSLKDKLDHALKMAAHYAQFEESGQSSYGSAMFKVKPPEVL